MRPLVSSSIILAAVALSGALVAVTSTRFGGGSITGASDGDATRLARSVHSHEAAGAAVSTTLPPDLPEGLPDAREFFFTRAIYNSGGRGWGWGGRGSWSTDYPKADRQFVTVLERLVGIDLYPTDHAIRLDDPNLRRFPFLYALEVGRMSLTPPEVHGLRSYLEAGGFLVIDDFWGEREWANFEYEIRKVLPGRSIVDMPAEHPLFSAFYDIDEILMVPAVGNAARGRYSECGPCQPAVKGIFDDDGRLMVVIHWNTDLGDAWEWAEDPYYPLDRSTFAYQMGANMIVYAMSH